MAEKSYDYQCFKCIDEIEKSNLGGMHQIMANKMKQVLASGSGEVHVCSRHKK